MPCRLLFCAAEFFGSTFPAPGLEPEKSSNSGLEKWRRGIFHGHQGKIRPRYSFKAMKITVNIATLTSEQKA
jgi:hypothetical protein